MKKMSACFIGASEIMRRRRAFLNGSYLEYTIVVLFFAALAIIYTDFVAFDITARLFASIGDATAGFMWYNFADHNPSLLLSHTDFVNYPYGVALGGPIFITYTALLVPMRILSFMFGAVAALNLVMLWGYIGAATFGYWLIKRLTGNVSVAIFSGFAIAYVPYAIYKSSNHINYIFSLVFILILAAFIALWSRPTKLRAIIFSFAIALAFYTDGYYILIASVMVVGLVLAGFSQLIIFQLKKIEYLRRLKVLLLSLGCLLLLITPIIYTQIACSNQIKGTLSAARGDISFEMAYYNLGPADFITPPEGNPLLKLIDSSGILTKHKVSHSNPGESMAYIGFVSLSLVVTGFVLIALWLINKKRSTINLLDNRTQKIYVLLGLITFISIPIMLSFMFSPTITIFGKTILLPGEFLIEHNIALWRVMGRFFIAFHVLITIFAGFTLWIILSYNKLTSKSAKLKPYIISAVVILLTLATAFEYRTTVNNGGFNLNSQPLAYQWLKKQENIKVIAEFPMVDTLSPFSSIYMTSQIYHGKKLINLKDSVDRQLTNTLGSVKNPEAIDFVYGRGAQAIVTHNSPCEDVQWGVVLFNDSQAGICIYSLDRPVSNDNTYVKFDTGFIYNPSESRMDSFATRIISNNLSLYFINQSFKKIDSGKERLIIDISPLARNDFNGDWVLKQNSITVASGQIVNSKARIDAVVSANSDVEIELNIPGVSIVPGDIEATDTTATSL